MMTVQTKADPRLNWGIIKSGLFSIIENSPVELDWGPADLLNCLMNGQAELTILFWNGEYAGFYVTRKLREEFKHRPYLFLWLIYVEPRHKVNAFKEVWPFIKDEARKYHAAYVSGMSPRKGWGRTMGTPWMMIYRRGLI